MPKRLTDTEIWDKEWFMTLPPKLKCLVKYLRDKCNMAGIWSPNWVLANSQIGEKVGERDLMEIDGGRQFEKTGSGKIYCRGFIEFQYGGHLNEKSPVHKKVIDFLEKEKFNPNTLSNTLPDRVCHTPKEEEEEKEKEVKGGVGEKPKINIPFKNFWDTYDKKCGKKAKLEKKWESLSDQDRLDIMVHIPKYVQAKPEKKFRKNPETFLNNESWKDEIIFETSVSNIVKSVQNFSPNVSKVDRSVQELNILYQSFLQDESWVTPLTIEPYHWPYLKKVGFLSFNETEKENIILSARSKINGSQVSTEYEKILLRKFAVLEYFKQLKAQGKETVFEL